MSEILTKAKTQMLLWRITIIFIVLYSLDAIATAFVSVMIDSNWDEMDGTQKLIRVFLIAKAWASAMLAFFTNVGKKLQSDQFPFEDDNLVTRRTEVRQTSVTESTPQEKPAT